MTTHDRELKLKQNQKKYGLHSWEIKSLKVPIPQKQQRNGEVILTVD